MAGDDTKSTFELDLDASGFIDSAKEASDALSNLTDVDGLKSLGASIGEVGAALAPVAVAVLAVKEAFDITFDAEQITQTRFEFDKLSESAGVYSETLLQGLQNSSKGWISENDLMTAANSAMAKLEVGVGQLPEIMEAARKASALMGGSVLDNFNAINQAVASGNTRQLRHIGIVIDQNKAYKDMAAQLGATTNELSLAGKQQAVLNAVLEYSSTKLKSVPDDLKPATSAWNQFKAAMKDTGESITLVLAKAVAPAVSAVTQALASFTSKMKENVTAVFGEGAAKAAAQMKQMKEQADQLSQAISNIEKTGTGFYNGTIKFKGDLDNLNKEYEKVRLNISLVEEEERKKQSLDSQAQQLNQQTVKTEEDKKNKLLDVGKVEQQNAKFAQDMTKLKTQMNKQELSEVDTIIGAQKLYAEQLKLNGQTYVDQIKKVEAEIKNQQISEKQGMKEIAMLKKLQDAAERQDDQQLYQYESQALQNSVQNSKTAFQAIDSNHKKMVFDEQQQNQTMVAQAKAGLDSWKQHSVEAFLEVGEGQRTVAGAMSAAALGVVADQAQAKGAFFLLDGIWPPNPVELAAGAGLVALAGFLRGAAGNAGAISGSIPIGSAGTGESGASTTISGTTPGSAPLPTQAATQTQQQAVSINIEGNYFDSKETQMAIVQAVRDASDATSFNINPIGQA